MVISLPKVIDFSRLILLLIMLFSISSSLWALSASMTLCTSLKNITWAVTADVVVARTPIIDANIIGPDTTSLFVLINANSWSAGESWMDLVLPFN